MKKQPTKEQERELMREMQEKRETDDRKSPDWVREFWERDDNNERIRRQLGWGLVR